MNIVKVELSVPKESKEVVDFLAKIITDLVAKKSIAEIAAGNLAMLMAAVGDFDQLGEEIKSQNRDDLAAYLVKVIMTALEKPEVVEAPVA